LSCIEESSDVRLADVGVCSVSEISSAQFKGVCVCRAGVHFACASFGVFSQAVIECVVIGMVVFAGLSSVGMGTSLPVA
jgi:hypothetical protein